MFWCIVWHLPHRGKCCEQGCHWLQVFGPQYGQRTADQSWGQLGLAWGWDRNRQGRGHVIIFNVLYMFSAELVSARVLNSETHSVTVTRGLISWLTSVVIIRPLRPPVWGGRETRVTMWVLSVSEDADITADTTPWWKQWPLQKWKGTSIRTLDLVITPHCRCIYT